MLANIYRPLPRGEYNIDSKEEGDIPEQHHFIHDSCEAVVALLIVLLLASLSANAWFLNRWDHRSQATRALCNNLPTPYEKPINAPEEFHSLNRTVQDAAWNDPQLNSWALFVALDDEWSASHGLPHSMRWPWDAHKGVYVLTAAHELHCVQVVRSFVNEKQDGVPEEELTWDYAHAMHCLNALRESIVCNADDLPVYTGRLHDNVRFETAVPGRGTTRMCRNWDALVDWAHEHSACYLSTAENRKDPNFAELDRYKYCPNGSRPWEGVAELAP